MNKIWHRIEHWFGCNKGIVETWWQGNKLMIGFRCLECDQISGVHQSYRQSYPPKEGK